MKPGQLSPAQLQALENLRDGRPAYDGLSGPAVREITRTLAALARQGYIDEDHRPTAAGLNYLKRYE